MSLVSPNQNADSCVSTLPLSGMPGAEHVVERGNAIGGDDQQQPVRILGERIDVANFALTVAREAVEAMFEERVTTTAMEETSWKGGDGRKTPILPRSRTTGKRKRNHY